MAQSTDDKFRGRYSARRAPPRLDRLGRAHWSKLASKSLFSTPVAARCSGCIS